MEVNLQIVHTLRRWILGLLAILWSRLGVCQVRSASTSWGNSCSSLKFVWSSTPVGSWNRSGGTEKVTQTQTQTQTHTQTHTHRPAENPPATCTASRGLVQALDPQHCPVSERGSWSRLSGALACSALQTSVRCRGLSRAKSREGTAFWNSVCGKL
jgi:hypothetical protein